MARDCLVRGQASLGETVQLLGDVSLFTGRAGRSRSCMRRPARNSASRCRDEDERNVPVADPWRPQRSFGHPRRCRETSQPPMIDRVCLAERRSTERWLAAGTGADHRHPVKSNRSFQDVLQAVSKIDVVVRIDARPGGSPDGQAAVHSGFERGPHAEDRIQGGTDQAVALRR